MLWSKWLDNSWSHYANRHQFSVSYVVNSCGDENHMLKVGQQFSERSSAVLYCATFPLPITLSSCPFLIYFPQWCLTNIFFLILLNKNATLNFEMNMSFYSCLANLFKLLCVYSFELWDSILKRATNLKNSFISFSILISHVLSHFVNSPEQHKEDIIIVCCKVLDDFYLFRRVRMSWPLGTNS